MFTPKRMLDAKKIHPIICVVFDDAWLTDNTVAYPTMLAKGIRGTSDVTTQNVGGSDYMTWNQIKEMYANGWDFQDHSHTHRNFVGLTDEEIIEELHTVDNYFSANNLPLPISFAQPASRTNDRVKRIISENGRLATFNTSDSLIHDKRDGMINPGFTFTAPWSGVYNMLTDNGLEKYKQLIDETVKRRDVLFVLFHRIVTTPNPTDPMEVDVARFSEFLDYGLAKGVKFMTITQVYNYITDYQSN